MAISKEWPQRKGVKAKRSIAGYILMFRIQNGARSNRKMMDFTAAVPQAHAAGRHRQAGRPAARAVLSLSYSCHWQRNSRFREKWGLRNSRFRVYLRVDNSRFRENLRIKASVSVYSAIFANDIETRVDYEKEDC